MLLKKITILSLAIIPVTSFAATPKNFTELVNFFLDYVKLLIPLVVMLTFAVFIWGLVKFISRVGGDENAVEDGRRLIIYGIGGLFVMVSLWAIVSLLLGEFNFGTLLIPQLPQ